MTLFHVFSFALMIGGLAVGGVVGLRTLGPLGVVVGAVLGGALGLVLGNAILVLSLRSTARDLGQKSLEELRRELRDPACLIPNLVLLELDRRSAVYQDDLDVVIQMLAHPSHDGRGRGWHALNSAFPQLLAQVPEYRVTSSDAACKEAVARLRVGAQSLGSTEVLRE